MIGAKYAAPILMPSTVAIAGLPAVHPLLPLSLTFDHRAVTGGEATRFLNAVIGDLELAG